MSKELAKTYDPKGIEDRIYQNWLDKKYFHAEVDRSKKPFTIVMPPPNVTGQLHMGHALDNTMQDILIRYKRMQGYNALWQPGTDHAAIATEVKVTDFSNLSLAKNMALADQTVPVGQYTRKALINAGMVGSEYTEVDQLTDDVISKALGGLEINNCANVGAVASAVAEGANEVGTVYYSDTFGYEDQLDIIEQLPNSLTGDVIYPVAAVESDHTSDEELEASEDFLTYLQSEEAVKLFEKYHFTVQ